MRLARLHRHCAPLSSPAPLLLPVRPIRAPNMGIGTSSDRAAALMIASSGMDGADGQRVNAVRRDSRNDGATASADWNDRFFIRVADLALGSPVKLTPAGGGPADQQYPGWDPSISGEFPSVGFAGVIPSEYSLSAPRCDTWAHVGAMARLPSSRRRD
jgi:hypothetical protein